MQNPTTIDDLSFFVACKMSEQQENNNNGGIATTETFVQTLKEIAMQLHVPWEHIQQRLAWEHMRQYSQGVSLPNSRHHIYLLIKRHCPDELSYLPERLQGLSSTQLLDVLVLLDEAFGGSAQASSCVGDGFREILLRNSVLERENAELALQLRNIRDKPKAQQNEAAFLVADLQQKLYESLATMQNMVNTVAQHSKKEPRNVGIQTTNNNSENQQNQQQQNNNVVATTATPAQIFVPCDHPRVIAQLEKKLEESVQRELAAKQEMLTRISQYSALANQIARKGLDNEKSPLEGCKHISIQTEPDAYLTRLQRERRLLLERLQNATELLKGGGGEKQSFFATPNKRI